MAVRNIVQIDEELCNGCGLCISSCAEGAIQLIDGKARLVKDQYCDGLGACLGECPQDAITIIQRDADEFNEHAVEQHLTSIGRQPAVHQPAPAPASKPAHHAGGGCPGSMMRDFSAKAAPVAAATTAEAVPSALRQWPVQLHLVPPTAPYFRDADLLLAADCSAFAFADFHRRFLVDHALAIACPKLDDPAGYVEKLAAMITDGGIRSITVMMMQVPCCRGLEHMVKQAVQLAGQQIPVKRIIVGIEGEILVEESL